MSYRDDARSSKAGKVSRVLGSASKSTSESVMDSEDAKGTPPIKKTVDNVVVSGKSPKSRMDRPARARGGAVSKKGKTNVTVIVAPQGGQQQPQVALGGVPPQMAAPPVVPPPGAPAMPPGAGVPPGMPPRAPMAPPQGMPMRQRGGRVKLDAGAGCGKGRMEKIAL